MHHHHPATLRALFTCGALIFASTAAAYEGPTGVTFRAPFIKQGGGSDDIELERILVQTKVRVDDKRSSDTDGKGPALVDQFTATTAPYRITTTTADSNIVLRLRNKGNREVQAVILVPYDASTWGTGFTEPRQATAAVDGQPASLIKGPFTQTLSENRYTIRSYHVSVEIPPRSTIALKLSATHQLAVHPTWYQFACVDPKAPYYRYGDPLVQYVRTQHLQNKIAQYRSLAPAGCNLTFTFDTADRHLKEQPWAFQWKRAAQGKPVIEWKQGAISFSGEAIEWVTVDPQRWVERFGGR